MERCVTEERWAHVCHSSEIHVPKRCVTRDMCITPYKGGHLYVQDNGSGSDIII